MTVVVVGSGPVRAAPVPANPKDSTLSALAVAGSGVTSIAPNFGPATRAYQVVSNDDASVGVTATPGEPLAAVVVTARAVTIPQTSGVANVPLLRGRNDVSIEVTSTDHSSVTVYALVVWRHIAPTPRIAELPPITTLAYGGTRFDVLLSDGALPSDCYREYEVRDGRRNEQGVATFDPKTGLTDAIGVTPRFDDGTPGKADLTILTTCYPPGGAFTSTVTARNAVTVLAGLTVTSSEIPATVTEASVFRVFGPGLTYDSSVTAWLEAADGEQYRLSRWGWTGPDQTEWYLDYEYEEEFFMQARPLTFHVGHYDGKGRAGGGAVSDFAKTVNFVPPAPGALSFSPSSGPLAGGSTFLLRGRFITSSIEYLTVNVGGIRANTNYRSAASDNKSYVAFLTGLDVVEVTVPPGVAPGLVPVTVETEYGKTLAPTQFRYSLRPKIDSISPASVAQTGGSVITVSGSDFGTAGTPSVIVGGVKSPLVNRVSATKLTAVVPPVSVTGTVAVSVTSPQGGGVSPSADLTVSAAGVLPTITRVSPATGTAGDPVTVTGTGFAPDGTVAVGVGGAWAFATYSSPTSLTFTIPAASAVGPQDVKVGTPAGLASLAAALQVLPAAGVTAVAPVTVPSYATGAGAQITLTGAGFGTTGTVQVGSAAAVAYTATQSGTRISGVAVSTAKAGVLPVLVTPKGAKAPLRSSVRVTGPAIGYVGPDPFASQYAVNNIDQGADGAMIFQVGTPGGSLSRIQGTGFGTGGVLTVAGSTVRTTTWSDTAITFTAPAHAAGPVPVSVKPTGSAIAAARAVGINYIPAVAKTPAIVAIASVVDHSYPSRTDFDPVADESAVFTLTGRDLAGTSSAATRLVIFDGSQSFTLTPSAVTATSLTFTAPRTFTLTGEWKTVQVITDSGQFQVDHGVFYRLDGTTVTAGPSIGYCGKTALTASGAVVYSPATTTITATATAFGTGGIVRLDGITVGTTSWSETQIVVDLAQLATPLANPWGGKIFVITPTDTAVPPRSIPFTCGVTPTVVTRANSSTAALTVAAGVSFTMDATSAGFVGPFSVSAPGGYEYVSDASYQSSAFDYGVRSGVPSAAGDYWVRVATAQATYDREPYLPFTAAPVHITIVGLPLTVSAVSGNGPSFVYKGQLVAGPSADFSYTATTATDPITKVTYEHRDVVCAGLGADAGWTTGLPGDVAISSQNCNGDGTSHSSWQVRVQSFEMTTSGTDRAGYYLATFPITTVDITAKPLTVTSVRSDKVWDATDAAPLGDLEVTGAVAGDTVALAGQSAGTFADAAVGVDKAVTLAADLALDGPAAGNYTLTNPRPTILGTISKASAHLALAASTGTVLLSQSPTVTITPTVTDATSGNPPDASADIAPVVLVSQTPLVCTVSGMTVTAIAAGVCVIGGTEAASASYLAATAVSDPASTTETVEFQVFAAPQTISVLADDLTVAENDPVDPSVQFSGLFDGDSITGVDYDYYLDDTLLPGVPAEIGTYKIMPKGGTLAAASTLVYNNPTAFTYVGGTLVITPAPPTITVIAPRTGTVSGGNLITITGTRLDSVRSVKIGTNTLTGGDLTVNDEGTELTFLAPAVLAAGQVDLILVAGTATASDVYTYTALTAGVPWVPRSVSLTAGGSSITVSFLRPLSDGGAAITAYQITVNAGQNWATRAITCQVYVCTMTLTGLTSGRVYPVKIRALNIVGPGPWSVTRSVLTNAPWSPVLPVPAGGLVPIPANPKAYQGPRRYTKALYTTHSGRRAAPIATLGAHQMVPGDAVTTLRGELFAFDSARLTPAGRAAVKSVALHLKLAKHVICEGYTDYAGEPAHERALSAARAKVICQTLITYGARVAFASYGYGGARPAVVGGTAKSRAENRRVVIRVDR